MFVDMLITASPDFFTGRSKKEVQAYFTEAVAFMEKKVGRENIFSAVVHMDEPPAPSPVLYSDHRGRPAVGQGDSGQPGAAFQMAGRGSRPYEKGVPRSQTGRERAGDKAQAHSHMAVQAVCRPHPPTAGH